MAAILPQPQCVWGDIQSKWANLSFNQKEMQQQVTKYQNRNIFWQNSLLAEFPQNVNNTEHYHS